MKSEKQMFDLIMDMAMKDERIRAVTMNGSRTNPNASRDFFQDFDIVYFVKDIEPFIENRSWISNFGEIMIMQTPDAWENDPDKMEGKFIYLMQFMDGNRIDLTFADLSLIDVLTEDSLTVLLLDKDNLIKELSEANDGDYLPKQPTAEDYDQCCNEFWWVSPYIAKGLWRDELPFVKEMMDLYVRKMLMRMLTWHVGVQTDFQVSPGKHSKYLKRYLEPELWELFVKTYPDAEYDNIWQALFTMCDLFRKAAKAVGTHFGYPYPIEDDKRVFAHLQHVKALPRDAKEIYP